MAQRMIDANELMDVIRAHDYPLTDSINSIDRGMFTIGIQQAVDEAPTVDAKPVVHGEWIENEVESSKHIEKIYECSACHNNEAWGDTEKTRYCSYCGADMRGGENGTD